MENQRKSSIEREIKEAAIRFQNERAKLESEVRKNRQLLANRDNEIEELREKCQRFENEMTDLKNYEGVIAENGDKILMLTNELHRVNQVLRSREKEIQSYRQNQFNLNLEMKDKYVWEQEVTNLKQLVNDLETEVEEWKLRT